MGALALNVGVRSPELGPFCKGKQYTSFVGDPSLLTDGGAPSRAIYFPVAGDVVLVMTSGPDLTLTVVAGAMLAIEATQIKAASTITKCAVFW